MVVILMGVSGSGKSTIGAKLASELGAEFMDADDFHSEGNIRKLRRGIPLADQDREPWLRDVASGIKAHRQKGHHVVVACSALKQAYRNLLIGPYDDVRVVYLKGSRELIGDRLAKRRGHFASPGLLDSQFHALEEPVGAIAINVEDTPDVVVAEIMNRLTTKNC